jgi:hypothetical protein
MQTLSRASDDASLTPRDLAHYHLVGQNDPDGIGSAALDANAIVTVAP